MKKAVGYIKFEESDKDSTEKRKMMIKRYASTNGIELQEIYVTEKNSQQSTEIITEMIVTMLAGNVRMVIVDQRDWLRVNEETISQVMICFAIRKIEVIDIKEDKNLTEQFQSENSKQVMMQIHDLFAKIDKAAALKKMRHGLAQKRTKTGKCEGKKGWHDFPERRAEILKRVRLLRKRQKGCNRQMSFQAIADRLNAEGMLTFTGKKWTSTGVANFFADWNATADK